MRTSHYSRMSTAPRLKATLELRPVEHERNLMVCDRSSVKRADSGVLGNVLPTDKLRVAAVHLV